jgi:hypothetical protein
VVNAVDKVLAAYINGSVLLDRPVDWPNGTRIELVPEKVARSPADEIEALRHAWADENSYGLDESIWPTTREGIDFLLAHLDSAEPLELSPEELDTFERELETNKQREKELTRKRWEELEKLF